MSDCAWCHEPVDCEHMAYVRDDERTYHDYCYPLALARELDEARALLRECRAAFDHALNGYWAAELGALLARLDAYLGDVRRGGAA